MGGVKVPSVNTSLRIQAFCADSLCVLGAPICSGFRHFRSNSQNEGARSPPSTERGLAFYCPKKKRIVNLVDLCSNTIALTP